jgi:hypothetical protein
MGQTISAAANFIAYPFSAIINIVAGENPDNDINITNSNIPEFNSDFASKEEKINFLINGLFNNLNSSVKTFNLNILFPYSQLLSDNLVIHGDADPTGEFYFDRDKIILIMEKIMKLYLTEHANHDPNIGTDYSKFFKSQYCNIKNNFQNIATSYNAIQPFLNANSHGTINIIDFKQKINEHFNEIFLKQYSIVQYLNLLLKVIEAFNNEIDVHIRFFKQENRGVLGSVYDYTAGFFTWLSRSGYSYHGTANFYTYFKNNNILLLKNRVTRKIESFTNAMNVLKSIRRDHESIDKHIKKNITDEFSITFYLDNNHEYTVTINLGDFKIENYQLLCNEIKLGVNKVINESNKQINFDILYIDDFQIEKYSENINEEFENKVESIRNTPRAESIRNTPRAESTENTPIDESTENDLVTNLINEASNEKEIKIKTFKSFENHILINCDKRFKLNQQSSIMKNLGWNSFTDVTSNNRLDNNHENNGDYFTLAPRRLCNTQLGNIINYSSRHNTIITSVTNFNTIMDIQNTQAANN